MATVGPGDMIWVPANCYTVESVDDSEDSFGFRWSMVTVRDEDRYKSFEGMANNKLTPSSHISKGVVQCYSRFLETVSS